MQSSYIQYIVIGVLALLLFGAGGYFLFYEKEEKEIVEAPVIEKIPAVVVSDPRVEVIGNSVDGNEIRTYTYGDGATQLLFVGGMHGGYEWNSVLVANEFNDYLTSNPDVVSDNLTVTVIPVLNPDGLMSVVGSGERFALTDVPVAKEDAIPGRFNGNGIDLNRNFDCKWKPESTWRGAVVSAGEEPFSEPEAKALRDFVEARNPATVVFWHSQGNAVYASECEEGILTETLVVMNIYAQAAGYQAIRSFNAYPITGDAEGWLASINIPAITVELSTHEIVEWDKNLKGITAIFEYYSNKGSAI